MTIYPHPKPAPRERKPPKRLQAKWFLKRHTRINAKRATERRTSKVRDRSYKDEVKLLRCCAPGAPSGCRGPIDPSHTDHDHGRGQKGDDTSCVPHCRKHHDDWENRPGAGVFKGWTKAQWRAYAAEMVGRTQAAIGIRRAA